MSDTVKCPKCSGTMAEGSMPQYRKGAVILSEWLEGAPEKRAFFGVKIDGKNGYEIKAMRCESCGFLELYAPKQ
jgi:predicted nucleic-acid-binding Zn-ribbon protein